MILVPFFASSTGYGSTKNLLSLPFQASVFFDQTPFQSLLIHKNSQLLLQSFNQEGMASLDNIMTYTDIVAVNWLVNLSFEGTNPTLQQNCIWYLKGAHIVLKGL